MTTALLVTQFTPSEVGHGGNHRGYQIVHDLERVPGIDRVTVVNFAEWSQRHTPAPPRLPPWQRAIATLRRRVASLIENPARIATRVAHYTPRHYGRPAFLEHYRQALARSVRPAFCVIEHTGFADIVAINDRCGLPTISCIQNLEAFEVLDAAGSKRSHLIARQIDFANELQVLRNCDERLFISKVEAGLIGGLGTSARYYPYLPVGRIRDRSEEIREQRSAAAIDPRLFVMVGSASHSTTRAGFRWFVEQARAHGLPPGVRVVVAGKHTDTLLPPGDAIPGIEFRGWIEQAELDQLTVHARAFLVPQHAGFGALTRLSELSCAGVPCIVSRHPTYALDLPPGVIIVEDDWANWTAALTCVANPEAMVSAAAYAAWEAQQPRTLHHVAAQLLKRRS